MAGAGGGTRDRTVNTAGGSGGGAVTQGTTPWTVAGTVTVAGLQNDALTDAELRFAPVPVSVASLPLPAGAATAANQQTDALTDTELRASPVPVSGTVTIQDGGNVITVDATNLDIRDLTFATDKIDVSNSTVRVQDTLNSVTDDEPQAAQFLSDVNGDPLQVAVRPLWYDGASWDRARGDSANGLDVDVTRLPAIPAGNNNIGDVDVATIAAGTTRIGGTYTVSGQIIDNDGDVLTVKVAHLDMSTATTTDIVAAVATKKIRVLSFSADTIEPATVTDINFVSGAGTTRCNGAPRFRLSADNLSRTGVAATGAFLFETVAGEALRVTQTGATDITVAVVYIEV